MNDDPRDPDEEPDAEDILAMQRAAIDQMMMAMPEVARLNAGVMQAHLAEGFTREESLEITKAIMLFTFEQGA